MAHKGPEELPTLMLDSVHYEMPKSNHIHKSMLLRGLEMPKPVLERADIEATRAKANSSGRSFGGASLRGDRNGGGRGGRINYADDRPNPFAAHINPNYAPPPAFGRGPPPGQYQSYGAPPPGANGYYGGPLPGQSYNGHHGSAGYGRPPGPQTDYRGGYNGPPAPPPYSYGQSASHYGPHQGSQYYRR